MARRMLIMGPQGVGKGTQAALLAKHYGIPTISTGDIFRYNLKNGTELGKRARAYTDKGELVPDELTNSIVEDRLGMEDVKQGWILDGYPRSSSQVEALDRMLARMGTGLDAVVALDADRQVLMDRMRKRAQEEGRADDTPEAIAKRLDIYAHETRPLLDVYRDRGLLVEIDGVGRIEEISRRIIAELDERAGR
ncbi:adenylate kinase [Bifidobacterium favimelis]|uniref:Adenylate kinase n=1 Tax=Bifidobacterium favimelis TaxID=3122979 RepID=A0ABU8ZLU1_9BIFI